MNRNTYLSLLYTFLVSAARSIFMQQILATFVFAIAGHSDRAVGYTSGAQGLAMLVSSIPGGILADRIPRHAVLRISAGFGFAGVALLSLSFLWGSLLFCYIGGVTWGLFMGLSTGAMEASFADSVATGRRSYIFAVKNALLQVGQALGPGATIFMFAFLGNRWAVEEMRVVLLVGAATAVPAVALLLFFHDRHALPDEPVLAPSRSVSGTSMKTIATDGPLRPAPGASAARRGDGDAGERDGSGAAAGASPAEGAGGGRGLHALGPPATIAAGQRPAEGVGKPRSPRLDDLEASLLMDLAMEGDGAGPGAAYWSRRLPPWAFVTGIFLLSDTVVSCGAGMTVKFFPLFFANQLCLTPVQVSIVYTLSPLVTALCTLLTQRVGKLVGRGVAVIAMKLVGTACLFGIVFLSDPLLCSALFILRTGVMNSTVGVEKSILMDVVPRYFRAKVNAVEGFTTFSWTGSAVLGGILVEARGYRFCFFVTAIVYTVGSSLLVFALRSIPPERDGFEPVPEGEEADGAHHAYHVALPTKLSCDGPGRRDSG